MSTLHSFSQGEILARTTNDPDILAGVCAALCAHWLAQIKGNPKGTPEQRLQFLQGQINTIIRDQQNYSAERRQFGPHTAQQILGARQGMVYDTDQTVVSARLPGVSAANSMANLKRRFKADISFPGKATAWSMRFATGGGHAIAGFCNIKPVPGGHQFQLHIFDPNVGEYIGTLQEADAMLDNLFRRPFYQTHPLAHARRILVS